MSDTNNNKEVYNLSCNNCCYGCSLKGPNQKCLQYTETSNIVICDEYKPETKLSEEIRNEKCLNRNPDKISIIAELLGFSVEELLHITDYQNAITAIKNLYNISKSYSEALREGE